MTTVAAQLEAAGVDLAAELPVRVRWSVACRTGTCRFALLQLPSLDVARRRAAEHVDVHTDHAVVVSADAGIPLAGGEL